MDRLSSTTNVLFFFGLIENFMFPALSDTFHMHRKIISEMFLQPVIRNPCNLTSICTVASASVYEGPFSESKRRLRGKGRLSLTV